VQRAQPFARIWREPQVFLLIPPPQAAKAKYELIYKGVQGTKLSPGFGVFPKSPINPATAGVNI